MIYKPTILIDIDGTLVRHKGNITSIILQEHLELLPGTLNKLNEWHNNGYKIILTTGRPKSLEKQTIKQLLSAGIVFDDIIFGLGNGPRILINDKKSDGTLTAYCHNLVRNTGLEDINI